jgi:triacylglycerol lipase
MITSKYSDSNASFFSKLAMNAYLNPPEFSEIYSEDYDIHYFDYQGTQCYALWDDKDLIYAFRGTEPTELADIEADLKFRKVESDVSGHIHRGFKQALDVVWDDIVDHCNSHVLITHALKRNTERRLFLTGHSLGAALATIAATRLGNSETQGYTFGSPRVGDKEFADNFCPEFYRFRNNNDIVTRHPMELIGFRHVGTLNYFDHNGKHSYKFSRWYMFKQFILGMLGGLKKFEIDSFHDHSSVTYHNLCRLLLDKLDNK